MGTIVAKKKKQNADERLELRVDPSLLPRLDRVAEMKGLTRSAYVRMVLMEALTRDEGKKITSEAGDTPCP